MTAVTPVQSMQERIAGRIKEQLGELVTPDELKPLVEQAIQDAFFKPRISKGAYDQILKQEPPVLVEMMRAELRSAIDEQVKAWLKNNQEKVQGMVTDTLGANVFDMVTGVIKLHTNDLFYRFGNDLAQRVTGNSSVFPYPVSGKF